MHPAIEQDDHHLKSEEFSQEIQQRTKIEPPLQEEILLPDAKDSLPKYEKDEILVKKLAQIRKEEEKEEERLEGKVLRNLNYKLYSTTPKKIK